MVEVHKLAHETKNELHKGADHLFHKVETPPQQQAANRFREESFQLMHNPLPALGGERTEVQNDWQKVFDKFQLVDSGSLLEAKHSSSADEKGPGSLEPASKNGEAEHQPAPAATNGKAEHQAVPNSKMVEPKIGIPNWMFNLMN